MLWDRQAGFARNRQAASEISIGDWIFLPDEAAVCRGTERRRLENRAAEVLAILAARRGAVVSADELIDQVWRGRSVSPNSVAIVIADLRRAIGDDARVSRFIETIPKRGYRLSADSSDQQADTPAQEKIRRLALLPLLAGIALLVALGFVLRDVSAAPAVPVGIAGFSNQTGNPRFDPLTASVRELTVTALGKFGNIRVERGNARPALVLSGRLIMWSGHPAAALSVDDARTGSVVWTGMAGGPEAAFPTQVRQQMADLAARLKTDAAVPITPLEDFFMIS